MPRIISEQDMLVAQSVQDTAVVIPKHESLQAIYSSHTVVFGAGTSAGAVVVEGSHDPNYTGTWYNLGTVTWAAATKAHNVTITGPHRAIRHRVSSTIVGGTVSSYADIVN